MGKRRGGKRPRLGSKAISPVEKPQLSSTAAAPRKVGILCHSMSTGKDAYYEVKLYVVDVDLKSRPNIFNTVAAPAVRFIFPSRSTILAVCVVKSTVYMFGGYDPYPRRPPEVRRKYARKFALPEEVLLSSDGNFQVRHDQLHVIPHMNHPKAFPLALPTPNCQKILVFAAYIDVEKSESAFELYDPEFLTWETLPGLPYSCWDCRMIHSRPCLCYSKIRCYSFVDEFHFFVEYGIGSFVLDLKEKKWANVGIPSVVGEYDLFNFVTAKGEYALISEGMALYLPDGGFLAVSEEARTFDTGPNFPLRKFPPPNTPDFLQQFNLPSIVCLGEVDEVCETGVLHIETTSRTEGSKARLLLDVCRTELTPFMRTTLSNSVSLHIDFLNELYAILLISLM